MANLENLKKQAKQIQRWHRDGYHPVAAQIRIWLATYRDLSDREILAQPFKLNDAQELVARKHGFEDWQALKNWPALKKGVATMTASAIQTAAAPFLSTAEPQLFVTDMPAACAFYVDRLGFKLAFAYGEPAFYAQVARDGARLNLRHVDAPVFDAALRAKDDLLSATITLDDAKALFLEYQARGVAFHQTLRTEPWGARTFIVADPDGNLIAFSAHG